MPIYEYKCMKCGHAFDYLARTLNAVAGKCPKCGARKPVKQFSTFTAAVGRTSRPCSTGECPASACQTGACRSGTCPLD